MEFLLIKLLDGIDSTDWVEESLTASESRYYNVTDLAQANSDCLLSMHNTNNMSIIFIVFNHSPGDDYIPLKLFLATGRKTSQGNIRYRTQYKCDSKFVIESFLKNFVIDLNEDFDKKVFLLRAEISSEYIRQFKQDVVDREPQEPEITDYQENQYETNVNCLHPFAQKNEHCKRYFESSDDNRKMAEYQKDRDSIVFSRSFRRMVDKAQIYTASKGDHFRSRMTHTLEVCQISRSIGIRLNLNLDLIEAIALAHDIGHTPFGHQGERTLQAILKRMWQEFKDAGIDIPFYGGFKHNFQALRVLTNLEEKHSEIDGVNVSYQVLEGVLKHTKFNGEFDKAQFLVNGCSELMFFDIDEPTTLEGQIVKIADEIAQRSHDIEDAFSAHHLSYNELLGHLSSSKTSKLKELVESCKEDIDMAKDESYSKIIIDEDSLLKSKIASSIIEFFINDVCMQSLQNMDEFSDTNPFYVQHHRFKERLIELSPEGQFLLTHLENIINKRVINSAEVASFDDRASRIIKCLFSTLYENPMKLPDTTLNRIYRDMRKCGLGTTRYREADIALVREEINRIHKALDEEYQEKNIILVRNIVDYIAGMTDTFAVNQYHLMYD